MEADKKSASSLPTDHKLSPKKRLGSKVDDRRSKEKRKIVIQSDSDGDEQEQKSRKKDKKRGHSPGKPRRSVNNSDRKRGSSPSKLRSVSKIDEKVDADDSKTNTDNKRSSCRTKYIDKVTCHRRIT